MAQTKVSLIKNGVVTVDNLHTNHGITTDHIGEGSTRQYFTESRVQNVLTTNNYIRTSDVANLETVTNLSINANVLSYTNEAGVTTNIDLSVYLDDSNLARIVSGALSPVTGIATFTRDDASTFTVDFSAFLSDANDYVTSASFNTTSGVLTLTRLGGGTVTVDLDGKYSVIGHTHSWTEISSRPTALSDFTNDSGYLTSETDPTVPVHVKSITSTNIINWNTAYGWGNHASAGYLTSLPSHNHNSLYVPLSRTITINGTTLDLSADRVFEISGGGGSEEFDIINIQTDTSINPSKNTINFTNLDTLCDSDQIIGGITFSSSDTRDTIGVYSSIKAYQNVIEEQGFDEFPFGPGQTTYYVGSDLRFYTSDKYYKNIERARFHGETGDFIIGKTDPYANNCVVIIPQGIIYSRRDASTNASHIIFFNGGSEKGRIQSSTSSTSYLTNSDYRLKENVVALTGALARVSLLKPSRFNFKTDPGKTMDGFLAHEVQEVVPESISGQKDAVDHNGNPEYQGIDQSKLVPLLTAALQEAITKIESLESRIQLLESK